MKLLSLILLAAVPLLHAAEIPSSTWQIKTAVLAAPEAERAGSTVLGYDAGGAVVTLRKGSNNFVCLADNPAQKGFSVACYHKDLEPFIVSGTPRWEVFRILAEA